MRPFSFHYGHIVLFPRRLTYIFCHHLLWRFEKLRGERRPRVMRLFVSRRNRMRTTTFRFVVTNIGRIWPIGPCGTGWWRVGVTPRWRWRRRVNIWCVCTGTGCFSSLKMSNIKTYTMLNQDVTFFQNSVDPDQLASEKPADQDLHCFPFCL